MVATPTTDGRTARKIDGMRRVQEAALDLFEARGFDEVRIEEIAAAAGVGPASVYRYFGTKEGIVLWDDYDPDLFSAVASRLPGSVVDAFQAGIGEALGRIYTRDKARILRRARLIIDTPAILAASAASRAAFRSALAQLLVSTRTCRAGLEADVVSGAVSAVLEAAIDHWVRQGGRTPLARLLTEAFAKLPPPGRER